MPDSVSEYRCRSCGSKNTELVVSLGKTPLADVLGLAYRNEDGLIYAADADGSFSSFDPFNGEQNLIGDGTLGAVALPRGLAFDQGTGVLYLGGETDELYTLDLGTGVPTLAGQLSLCEGTIGDGGVELNLNTVSGDVDLRRRRR